MDLISVIVPVYQVEPYLARCVRSLRTQTYKHLEILLIDDGSPDRCGAMCDAFANEDSRIRVIHKPNGGLSDARNTGLAAATGEYIAFLDSDDWADPTWLETLHRLCGEYHAEIGECSYRNIFTDSIREESTCSGAVLTFTPVQAMECNLDWHHCKTVAWNKLYHRSIIGDIRYPVGKLHEDEFTTHLFYLAASRIVYADLSLINYERRNPSSITAAFSLRNLDSCQALRSRVYLVWSRPDLSAIAEKTANVYLWTVFERLNSCRIHGLSGPALTQTVQNLLEDYPLLLRHGFDSNYIPAIERLKSAVQGGAYP